MHTPQRAFKNQDQFSQFNQQCVCQICTCGRHHCPPNQTKFLGETTNHHDYKAYNITAKNPEVCHHEVKQRHYDPEALKTSYVKDFPAYKIQPHLNPNKLEYKQVKQPFYDETQYKKSYLPYQVAVQRPATCTHTQYRNRAKFDGTTTYRLEYSPKHVQRVPQSPHYYQMKKIPFSGESMYHSEFKPHQIQVTKPQVCVCNAYQGRKNKFMGQSRYHEDFKPYKVQKQCTCPINIMPSMPRNCSPNKNHLNYSAQKHRWE